jgi:hypothetical protein
VSAITAMRIDDTLAGRRDFARRKAAARAGRAIKTR